MPLIIPQFTLEQDEKHIIISLRLPYVKPTKSEFSIIGKSFSFYLKPYLLQLTFNEFLKDSEQPAKAVYDPQLYNLKVYIEKLNFGEQFTQLDMIGLLMNKKNKQQNKKPKGQLIQVLENNSEENENLQQQEITHLQQESYSYQNPYLYGFNNQYKDVFDDLEEELLELSILDPKQIAYTDRAALALQYIQKSFDEEAYIFDLLENETIDDCLEWNFNSKDQFSIEQINRLNKLEKREYLIESKQFCLQGLVDILFSYLYELIVFQGELTLESAVTINSLSSQFQAFYVGDSVKETLINNFQRAITFPMFRSFELCQKAKLLLETVLNEKVQVMKVLLEVESLFSKAKPRNYLNLIYLEDYIIWIQTIEKDDLKLLSKQIKSINIQKEDLQLNLTIIEKEAINKAFS